MPARQDARQNEKTREDMLLELQQKYEAQIYD
jgi:hypothetical protein